MRPPIAFARMVGDRLHVECPTCQLMSEIDYVGVRPLPRCAHVVDVRARTDRLRVVKARGWSVCPSCQRAVMPGQRIASSGDGWAHLSCQLRGRDSAQEGATDGGRH